MGTVNLLPGSELMAVPGAQLQGINVQGVDINKDHVAINIDWLDPVTKLYFDPVNASVSVTKDSVGYTIQKVLVPLRRRDDSVGVWGYEFLTNGMDAGNYVLTFTGAVPGTSLTVTHVLGFTAAQAPIEQYFIGCLRAKLWDKRASRYLIDDNQRTRWTNGELYSFLDNSRLKVGQVPPSPALITWERGFAECHDLILTGGFIEALEAAGIFETFNKFNYNDELTLNVDRSAFFQNAQSLKQQWMTAVLSWKRDAAFHKLAGGIGMASGKFPLYYTRTLSLLPHMSNTFYG